MLITGCAGEPSSGPVEVKWDRNQCERCRMVVSDRMYAAQVRMPLPDGRSRIMHFDDIGCAVIWIEDKEWQADPRTEIWVTDYRNGKWIDARTATYVPGKITPMGYGLGAQTESVEGGLDYSQAADHIFESEKRLNRHGLDHDHGDTGKGTQ